MKSHEVKTFFFTLILGSISVATVHSILVYFHLLESPISDASGLHILTDSFFIGLMYGVIVSLLVMSIVSLIKKRRIEPHILKYMFVAGLVTSLGSLVLEVMSPVLMTLEPIDFIFVLIVRFLPGMLVGALIWLVIWLIQDTTTEGKFLHHELFDHKAKSPHWPRIILMVLFVMVGYALGYYSLYPTVLEADQRLAFYDELVRNTYQGESAAANNKNTLINDKNYTYTNTLLGIKVTLPLGWYGAADSGVPVEHLAIYGNGYGIINLTNYIPTAEDGTEMLMPKPNEQTITLMVMRADPRLVQEQQETYKLSKATEVIVGGVKGMVMLNKQSVESEDKSSFELQEKKYLFIHNKLIFEFSASQIATQNPSFAEFDQMVRSTVFLKK